MSTEKTFEDKVLDLYFEDYFRKLKGHDDWTDEQITFGTCEADIEDFVSVVRDALIKGI